MSYLYVLEHGSIISFSENYVRVTCKDDMCKMVPVETLEGISIFSKSQMTTQCTEECLKRGIPVSYYSKNGRYFGRLISTGHINAMRQRKQAALYETEFAVRLGCRIMKAKIRNQEVILRRYQRTTGINVDEERSKMHYSAEKLDRCRTIEQISGYEGIAARNYFQALEKLVDKVFSFHGRTRRPPQDKFNSMLSLGYSILLNEIYGKIESKGLNPYFGFIHKDHENHPTLGSDLMEEWRAVIIDSLAMSLANGHEILPEHFLEEDGIILTKAGMTVFINKLEQKLRTDVSYLDYVNYRVNFRRAMDLQVNCLVQAIESQNADFYHPVVIR